MAVVLASAAGVGASVVDEAIAVQHLRFYSDYSTETGEKEAR